MSPGPAFEKFNDPRTPPACEAYPGKRCSTGGIMDSEILNDILVSLRVISAGVWLLAGFLIWRMK